MIFVRYVWMQRGASDFYYSMRESEAISQITSKKSCVAKDQTLAAVCLSVASSLNIYRIQFSFKQKIGSALQMLSPILGYIGAIITNLCNIRIRILEVWPAATSLAVNPGTQGVLKATAHLHTFIFLKSRCVSFLFITVSTMTTTAPTL